MSIPLSVVVPTRDRPEMLRRCLASIRKSLGDAGELIVVDSASRDEAAVSIAAEVGARYLKAELPGAGRARNAGWRAATQEVVGFVDDDMTVAPDWAETVRDAFAMKPGLGFVTGKVLPPPEQAGAAHPIALVDAPDALDHQPRTARHEGISGNFAARRGALASIGGFDELLGAGVPFKGGEDFDLFDRLIASGVPGRYEPSILAHHDQWRSKRERLKLDFGYGIGAGARLAKLMRADRQHARAVARDVLWRWGLLDFVNCIRKRYEYGAIAALYRLAGIVRGLVGGLAIPVVDGHFAPRRRKRSATRAA
ncbi:MAG: glycosyltransferase [Actinomycetota bacterium]